MENVREGKREGNGEEWEIFGAGLLGEKGGEDGEGGALRFLRGIRERGEGENGF